MGKVADGLRRKIISEDVSSFLLYSNCHNNLSRDKQYDHNNLTDYNGRRVRLSKAEDRLVKRADEIIGRRGKPLAIKRRELGREVGTYYLMNFKLAALHLRRSQEVLRDNFYSFGRVIYA